MSQSDIPTYADLPPFREPNREFRCDTCGYDLTMGPARPAVESCSGSPRERVDEACELGGPDPHLHIQCPRCKKWTPMQNADGIPALKAGEIQAIREALPYLPWIKRLIDEEVSARAEPSEGAQKATGG